LVLLRYNAIAMAREGTTVGRPSEERIRNLLAPFLSANQLLPIQLDQVSTYLDLLLRWNFKINLTGVRDPEEIVTRHFGESFFAARRLLADPALAASAIDVGSGAGFPGLPLKIWSPQVRLTLAEANNKKVAFLREVVRALGLSDVTVLAVRAENLGAQADLVTLRAVEQFEKILPIARGMVKDSGRLALLIGESQLEAAKVICPDLRWNNAARIPYSRNRVLAVGALP